MMPASQRQTKIDSAFVRDTLHAERARLSDKKTFKEDGYDASRCFSGIVDELLKKAFLKLKEDKNQTIALIAVGGYGRGLLCPFSDIDLLFLTEQSLRKKEEKLIKGILYAFWDAGVTIGYAVNTMAQALKRMQDDKITHTAFLDARLLVGEKNLYWNFIKQRNARHQEIGVVNFINAKLAEQTLRHKKRGDSRYFLEPNIKENKGALRDLDMLHWMIRATHPQSTATEWAELGFLTKKEVKRFFDALRFILTIRWHLHQRSGRKEETLSFHDQIDIAKQLGYRNNARTRGVEDFMRRYFLVARDVGLLTHTIYAELNESISSSFTPLSEFKPINYTSLAREATLAGKQKNINWEKITLERNMLVVPKATYFQKRPMEMIRIFYLSGQVQRHIHPKTLSQLSRNLSGLTSLCSDPVANRYFVKLLSMGGQSDKLLRWMNYTGVLERFFPEFKHLIGQMQFDMYHVYTTDEHTFHAIKFLNAIDAGMMKDIHPLASQIITQISSRDVLYVAVLLHDIAKGLEGDHSIEGEKIAYVVCRRFGFNEEETSMVAWLVRMHLVMSNTAFKRDLNEQKTIDDFAAIVQYPERLRLLLCLTVVDIRAVGPEVWTVWKAALLRELYYKAEAKMRGQHYIEHPHHQDSKEMSTFLFPHLSPLLPEWSKEKCQSYLALYSHTRLFALPYKKIAQRITFLDQWNQGGHPVAIEKDKEQAMVEFMISIWPKKGQLSALAGVFAHSAMSIIDASCDVLANGSALYHFHIGDHYAADRLERVKRKLSTVVTSHLHETAKPVLSLYKQARPFPLKSTILIDNEASSDHTVIEISGFDRPGLLCDLVHTFDQHDIKVGAAKIATYGEMATDVFYIKNIFGLKILSKTKKQQLEKALLHVLGTASQ